MNKAFLSIVVVVLSAVSILAQQGDPPPAVPDYSPDAWKEYTYKQDNIRFRFPAEPKVTESSEDKGRRYSRKSFIDFSVNVAGAGIDVGRDKEKQQKYLILIALSLNKTFESSGAKLIKSEDTAVDGHPAKFFVFETKEGILTRAKIFVLKDQVYFAETSVKKGERHGFNWENDFEKPAMAFLDSIHFISN